MMMLKILTALIGITAVFCGFYLAMVKESKKENLGFSVALAGFLLFLFASLVIFVPDFFK
jgi:hypothetical protein